ncbi:hypothetical protein CLAFUW4_02914 [Fulvia fulva]|uniref:DUF4291 domain-containing protein n=1 Tax=Passalora fulva TaxID=5499 RepID=A0A9Q8LAJ1_PASFU|nr:uncharacterized protein CLAFUR5_02901 [Fulvia fulva]KAK4631865.1 hypothetical protein CLAFUR4_02907 [Fulvia fulva]KAK4632654.1 hypothetical protein CLAFUR0_02910 [Fulvia fulva]UJO13882.1 hypothetical protein CLAFUR5_02901 [Fulvia fulva]WPV11373.1 hypothetical protein CLAFUW4_02914 [Fulvia fulva]WPV25388.1 hypothetical protein CLAFUW7_02911 [Fulvia fulva]
MSTSYRTIRASFDEDCVVVYQAYNASIASAAVEHQILSASSLLKPGRMTWIKPSWCWMMYRSGYSYKDLNQERILAIRMKHEHFAELLSNACLAESPHARGESVVVQWDPERGPRLEKLDYRTIQIGIPGSIRDKWIAEWIEDIEDVTERARSMKRMLDDDAAIDAGRLIERSLMPEERPCAVDDAIIQRLEMSTHD